MWSVVVEGSSPVGVKLLLSDAVTLWLSFLGYGEYEYDGFNVVIRRRWL